jgi:hypothetical protein
MKLFFKRARKSHWIIPGMLIENSKPDTCYLGTYSGLVHRILRCGSGWRLYFKPNHRCKCYHPRDMNGNCVKCSSNALWVGVLSVTTVGLIAVVAVLASWKRTNHAPPPPRGILRKPYYPGYPWKRPPPGWVDECGRTLEQIWDDEDGEDRLYIETPMPTPPPPSDEGSEEHDW